MTPEQFKQIRKNKGLSQHKMAEFLGLNYRTVQRFEAGERDIPKYVVIILKLSGDLRA